MEAIINDLLDSYKRLNSELADRINFEHLLMDKISQQEKEISELKEKVAYYENTEQRKEMYDEAKTSLRVENAIKECISQKGILDNDTSN